MALKSLADFVSLLDQAGELKRISAPVSADLEITEIADRVVKQAGGGPALLFENVTGFSMPVLINAYASRRRMSLALGCDDFDQIADRIEKLLHQAPPEGWIEKVKMLPQLASLTSALPKNVSSGSCQSVVVDNPSLESLPVLKCWPEDGGRTITLPQVYTKDPKSGRRNVGLYRMQVYDAKCAGMHWQKHKDGADHHRQSLAQGVTKIPAAIVIGGDPVLTYAATAPLPPMMDEMMLAGFIREKSVEMVKCKSQDLEVPASADIVLEGYVDLEDMRVEGPFGDHTGYYSLEDKYPTFHLTGMTTNPNPIYLTTIVGRPPMEDEFIGLATERIFMPLIRTQLPEVVDLHMPVEGVFHNLVIVSIKKKYPGHAFKVMNSLWGLGQMMFAKCILVVDHDVNVHDPKEVCWRVSNNIDPKRDLLLTHGPVDSLDHASPMPDFGSKMGLDATTKTKAEGFNRPWPGDVVMSDEIKQKVSERWDEYGISLD